MIVRSRSGAMRRARALALALLLRTMTAAGRVRAVSSWSFGDGNAGMDAIQAAVLGHIGLVDLSLREQILQVVTHVGLLVATIEQSDCRRFVLAQKTQSSVRRFGGAELP